MKKSIFIGICSLLLGSQAKRGSAFPENYGREPSTATDSRRWQTKTKNHRCLPHSVPG